VNYLCQEKAFAIMVDVLGLIHLFQDDIDGARRCIGQVTDPLTLDYAPTQVERPGFPFPLYRARALEGLQDQPG
jgi:hypothetical protein